MNFKEFFLLLHSFFTIIWDDNTGYWHCFGCGRDMDSSEKELHWNWQRCTLRKKKNLQGLRALIIDANQELYRKYLADNGIEVNEILSKSEPTAKMSWYRKQQKQLSELLLNLEEPSGARTDDSMYPPIPLRIPTKEELVPKPCIRRYLDTEDKICNSFPMRDEPYRDLDGSIIEDLQSFEKIQKEKYRLAN